MKRLLQSFLSVLCIVFSFEVGAQQLQKAEYFVDVDPGVGKGTAIALGSLADSMDVTGIQLSTSGLGLGLHTLHVRVKDQSGLWSAYKSTIFKIQGLSDTINSKISPLMTGEYFVDVDPGIGKGTSIPFTSSDSILATNLQVDITGLSYGVHVVGVRVKDGIGRWSAYHTNIFTVLNTSKSSDTLVNKSGKMVYAEYFVDTDPGAGKGVSIPVTSGDSLAINDISVSTDMLSLGIHSLHVRVRDEYHRWSAYHSSIFRISNSSKTSDTLINIPGKIIYSEYFVDKDPGFGKGISIPLVFGDSVNTEGILVSTDGLSVGIHTLGVRVLDEFARWSAYHSSFFNILDPLKIKDSVLNRVGSIVRAEYFVDTDPGFGKGIALPLTSGDSVTLDSILVNTNSLKPGIHNLDVRVQDEYHRWSAYKSAFFHILTASDVKDSLLTKIGKIVYTEYFVDNDPGLGKGVALPVAAGDSIVLTGILLNTDTLSPGIHSLQIRVRDEFYHWSAYHSAIFNIVTGSEIVKKLPFVSGEYFIGSIDPGYGNASLLTNLPSPDTLWNFTPEISTDGLEIGTYPVTFRLLRQDRTWTFNNTFTFDVCLAFPPAPTASGSLICGGQGTAHLVAHGVDSVKNYAWFTDSWGGSAVNLNGDSAFITPSLSQTTHYWAAQVGAQCTGPRTEVEVAVVEKLASPIVPSIVNHCGAGKVLLSLSGTSDSVNYRWYSKLRDKVWLAVGDTFITDSISLSRKYYVSTISKDGLCESPIRDSIKVVIKSCSTQTIIFPKLLDIIYGEVPYVVLKATTSSKLPIVYNVSGPVDIHGDTLSPTGYGKVTVTATQLGSDNFYPATSSTQSFKITSRTDTVDHSDTVEHFSIHYDSTLCTGEQLQFLVAYTGNAIYKWTGPNYFTSSLQSPSRYNLDTADAGNYTLTIKTAKDSLRFSYKVYVYKSPPKISLYSLQRNVCNQDDTLFTVGDNLVRYQWLYNAKNIIGAIDSIYIPRFTGVYSVAGYDANNCSTNSDLRYVDVVPDTLPQITIVKSQGYLTTALAQSYQWYVEGYFVVEGNKQELPCYFNGTYQVIITDSKGCEKFSIPYTVNDSHLSNLRPDMVSADGQVLLDSYHPERLDLVPNPASHFANLSWTSPERGLLTLTVLNEIGAEIIRVTVNKEYELFTYSFDISGWKAGIYLISVGEGKKNVKGKLIVVK